MRQAERVLRIQDIFSRQGFVGFDELGRLLSASKSSIRRDLLELERKNVIRRVHGGAISLQTREDSLDFTRLSDSSQSEKSRIGALAASFIEDGQTVIMGGGSTVAEVARHLGEKSVQIVTNSIPVAQIFWDNRQVEVTITGGYLFPRLGIQLGPICEKMLKDVSADLLILGIRGITASGISDTNSLIVESIRAMIQSAAKVMIVADHSKFGRNAMIHVAPLSEIDHVVSDSGLAEEYRQIIEKQGLTCSLA